MKMIPQGGVRCECKTHPLLAVCGVESETGEPMVHIKHMRHGRLLTESIVTSGVVKVRCRNCSRWWRIKVGRDGPRLVATRVLIAGHRDFK